ncbi:ParB/RepB/Spo0J family partition protein [Methylobacterium sp. NMS12]|uniref:ParB/RepB/Spo0J family partition protein n=1 Tax=Methylobacterium sp. NMS12 TaxID=3079766 RepID=UPI003F883D3C
MLGSSRNQKLRSIPTSQIRPNPENPRLIFRQEEMESLMRSIDSYGIQVPLTLYFEDDFFYLIDGERRWRCAKKLNLAAVPAIVQDKPTELENLVLMYNIHALREQWDYYTIASKLERVIALYRLEHFRPPNEIELSELTGLTRGAIRRCHLLLDLPDRFKSLLREELDKPKSQQRLTEDLFIEMEKSLKAVTRRLPEYSTRIDEIRDTLVTKFQEKTISAVTDFRQLSKIATAVEGLGVAHRTAKRALDQIFDPSKTVTIREAYAATVEFEYGEKKASRYVTSLLDFLADVEEDDKVNELDAALRKELESLYARLQALLSR